MNLTLEPEFDINPICTEHTVTATLTIVGSGPAVGEPIYFEVISGPNAGVNETNVTDSNGQATFTYTGSDEVGIDTINASWI